MSWDKPLARELAIRDGQPLVTLRDAARLLAGRLDDLKHASPLESAIEWLLRAASSNGKRDDIEAATEQVARMLQLWRISD
jgi:hypothetical protein